MQQLTIPGRFPDYNQLNKGHWAVRNRMKQDASGLVGWEIKRQHIRPVTGKAIVKITCYEKDKRRDPSNVRAGAEKVILDALQEFGIIRNDNSRWLADNPATVGYDKVNPHVEITISEA